jgi:hypothetical protein
VVNPTEITNVEFYANSNDLGRGFSLGATVRPPGAYLPNIQLAGPSMWRLGAVYCLVWSNAPTGSYALTAVTKERELTPIATNFYLTNYISRTSAPVNITILPPPPPTNTPSVVSIVATDPHCHRRHKFMDLARPIKRDPGMDKLAASHSSALHKLGTEGRPLYRAPLRRRFFRDYRGIFHEALPATEWTTPTYRGLSPWPWANPTV